jgi:pimeloyl-ACP methyl ester carboxylesterase
MWLMMKSKLFRLLRSIMIAYLIVCTLVGVFQRRLIYLPFHKSEDAMMAQAQSHGLEAWRDSSGAIIGWKRPPSSGAPAANRLVVFHGNAGYALLRTHFIDGFAGLDDGRAWEVYLFEYPGFGARSGELGERPFIDAGLAALRELRQADARPIYLLGESLGSGLACALAGRAEDQIAGLFLLTPYARLADVAAHHSGFLPVRLLLRDRWDNPAALQRYPGPLAMLIAEEDEVVTAAQGRLLFDAFAGSKRLWTETGARHNTLDFSRTNPWWREVSEYLLSAKVAN